MAAVRAGAHPDGLRSGVSDLHPVDEPVSVGGLRRRRLSEREVSGDRWVNLEQRAGFNNDRANVVPECRLVHDQAAEILSPPSKFDLPR